MTDRNIPISGYVTTKSILEDKSKPEKQKKAGSIGSWIIFILGMIYFFVPLLSVFEFSLRKIRGIYSFEAYRLAFIDPEFYRNFGMSLMWAALTIIVSLALIVPTAYWVHLRLRRMRPIVEFFTLMPFVVPAVVLVFGMARLYSRVRFMVELPVLLIAGYVVLSFPYMFRAVDAGLRAIDVRTLTEAAQSLGAGWRVILFKIIFPNLRTAILSGVFLTFAIVMGEFTFASLLSFDAFGPYMEETGAMVAYTPQALSVVSFLITWACIGAMQRMAKGAPGEIAGAR